MLLNKIIDPSEGEVSVRSYLCTSFNSFLLGIKADGYLEVTNKRLLFQAVGKSSSKNKSVIHSEIPISEVVGVNIYKGKGFNLLRLAGGFFLTAIISAIVVLVVTNLLSFLQDSPKIYQFIIWLLFIGSIVLAYRNKDESSDLHDDAIKREVKDNSFPELLILAVGLGFLATLFKNSMGYYNQFGTSSIAIPVYLVVLIIALYRYAKKPAFSLFIHSKSGSNVVVRIAGPAPMGMGNSTAGKALTAKPGPDSLLILKELGAVVLDIQNMGDYGIEKWQAKSKN